MKSFHPEMPEHCPEDAEEVSAVLYRACGSNPATAEDFTPHVTSADPRKRERADPQKCEGWGLSVWRTEEDVEHARTLLRWLQKKYIFKGRVSPDDGQLKQTGQPGHHTFWVYQGVEIQSKFRMTKTPLLGNS